MKRVIAIVGIVMLACTSLIANAASYGVERYVRQAKDTCINQDTVYEYYNAIPSNVTILKARVTRISGTIAAGSYVVLQGLTSHDEWEDVNTDSLKLTNQAVNFKTWPISRTTFYSYRIRYITPSSTQRTVLEFIMVRRPDE